MKTLTQTITENPSLFELEEYKTALHEAILKLPDDQQKALELHFTRKIAVSEIAKQLNCSVTTIYSRINRALFALRNEFNPAVYERMYKILYPETGKPTVAS